MLRIKNILIAEDDDDDFGFFQEAILEISPETNLIRAKNGIELIDSLKEQVLLPEFLFLDINMPLKNGYECLTSIRADKNLNPLIIITFSTSSEKSIVDWMYNSGANGYLVKPNSFQGLKKCIQKAMVIDWQSMEPLINSETFLISEL
jgi:CheY-like chemotaxis protein